MTYLAPYLASIAGLEIQSNNHSRETEQKRYDFLKAYPCLLEDKTYVSFLKEYNGLSAGVMDQFAFLFYGFALPEPEVIRAIHQYQGTDGFIIIGEYISKRKAENWFHILYFFHPKKRTKVFAKFTRNREETSDYRLLCESFAELIGLVVRKSYTEQYELSKPI